MPWSSTLDTILLESKVIRKVELYIRNGYQSVLGESFNLVEDCPEFSIRLDRESLCGTLEVPLANTNFQYSDEYDQNNPAVMVAEVLLKCTIYHTSLPGGSESQYIFRGFLIQATPDNYEFGIVCVDKLHRCENSTCELDTEANIVATLDTTTHPSNGPTLMAVPLEYDAYTFAIDWGVPGQLVAYGQNHLPPAIIERRAWVLRGTRVLFNGIELSMDKYEVIPHLGLIKFYELPAAGTYTLESVSFYEEGTNCVEDIIEEGLRTDGPNIYVPGITEPGNGPGFTDAELTENLSGTITITNGSKTVIGVGTTFQSDFSPGKRVKGTANSIWGVVASIDIPNPDTVMYLAYAYKGVTQVGVPYHRSSLDHAYASVSQFNWTETDGRVGDMIRKLREDHTRRDYFIFYDSVDDKIRGRKAEIKTAPDPVDRNLINAQRIKSPRKFQEVYTRVLSIGTYERPQNLMETANSIILQQALPGPPGVHERTGVWNGYTFIDSAITDPIFNMLHDGDYYTCHGLESSLWGETTYFDYLIVDLGAVKFITKMYFYPIGARNPNKFPMGISIFTSIDGINYIEADPSAYHRDLEPGPTPFVLEEPAHGVARYIKISMRPCKWVLTGSQRTFGLSEIRLFGSERVAGEAKIQDITPAGGRWVGGVWLPTYYPLMMRKVSVLGHKTFLDEDAPVWDQISSDDRAHVILNEKIRMFKPGSWECPFDPRNMLLDTVQISDDFFPSAPDVQRNLIEGIELGFDRSVIEGTDYAVGVASGE